jgi:alkylation response protein AidB-like acyl-CoA dehydrogenase
MNFELNENQLMITQMVRDFAEKEIKPHFKKWDGDRLTFLQKKWFVVALGGSARSPAAFWNKIVTLCLRWQFLEGMIENEISLLGWLFGLLDGGNAHGRRVATDPIRLSRTRCCQRVAGGQ